MGREAMTRTSGKLARILASSAGTSAWTLKASDSSSGTKTTSSTPWLTSLLTICMPLGVQWSRKAT
jgi:hypothetical protein